LGVGAHHPIGEAALLVLDLLGEIPHRRQLQRPLKQLVGFRFVGLALDGEQALGVGEQVDRILCGHRRCGP
jgi:hypothetical protein